MANNLNQQLVILLTLIHMSLYSQAVLILIQIFDNASFTTKLISNATFLYGREFLSSILIPFVEPMLDCPGVSYEVIKEREREKRREKERDREKERERERELIHVYSYIS